MDKILLKIARDAIRQRLFMDTLIDKKGLIEQYPFLNELKGVFVTLTIDGNLRGCIGSLIAKRSLIDDIISNAVSAAFYDHRFKPLSKEEFNKIKIEVSILSTPKHLEYTNMKELKKKLIPNKHGVIVQLDGKQATFLPSVWEQLGNDFNIFMTHLFQKAHIDPSKMTQLPEIFTYTVDKIEE
jgi:AmmeMemoRadiSam system protein A